MPGAALSRSRRSSRSWASNLSSSIRHQTIGLQPDTDDPFRRGSASSSRRHDEDEENLRWAALEKLPTYDRMRRAIPLANHDLGVGGSNGLVEIELLASGDGGRALLERVLQDDSERFLRSLRDRLDRVGIELPSIEVRYEGLSVEVDAFVGSSALPTLWNVTANFLRVRCHLHACSASSCSAHHVLLNSSSTMREPVGTCMRVHALYVQT
jgi:hypothetical protein